jgi:hypothetical protein
MTDTDITTDEPDLDWHAFAAAETQQFYDEIQAFRDAAAKLGRERAAECDFPYEAYLQALVDGLVAITEQFRPYSYFVGDMWSAPIGEAAEEAAEHLADSARLLAAVYGQVLALPQVPESGTPRPVARETA